MSEPVSTQIDMPVNPLHVHPLDTAVLEGIADGVLVCDREGTVIVANGVSARLLDLPLATLLAATLADVLAALGIDEWLQRGGQGDAFAAQPTRRTTVRRGVRSLTVVLDPVRNENDEVVGSVVIVHDITREIAGERLKTEFIGTMSHELRTPMTVINGYVQLMDLGALGDLSTMQREVLATIHANAERMMAVINDVLDITKLEAGSVELDLQPTSLQTALEVVVRRRAAQIGARNHDFQLDVPTDLPLVHADPVRLGQILDNLLSNAIKYTPKGGSISCTATRYDSGALPTDRRRALDPEQPYVVLALADTGIGIPPEHIPHIWDRFYRVDTELTVEAGGTGLGLALVRSLAQLMRGDIWVDSRVGAGSTFTVVLPATQP